MDAKYALFEMSMDENDNPLNQTDKDDFNVSSAKTMSLTKKSKKTTRKAENADKENSAVFDFASSTKKSKSRKRLNVTNPLATRKANDSKTTKQNKSRTATTTRKQTAKSVYDEEVDEELRKMAKEFEDVSNHKLIVE